MVEEILGIYLFIVVRNYEGSEILPNTQAHNLACHCFTDVNRSHKIPGSEAKECITHGTAGSMSYKITIVSLTAQDP